MIIISTVKVLSSLNLSKKKKRTDKRRTECTVLLWGVSAIMFTLLPVISSASLQTFHIVISAGEMIAFENSTRTFALRHPQWIPQSFQFFLRFQRTQIADTSTLIRAINCAVIIFRWLPFGSAAVAIHIFHTNYLIHMWREINNPNTGW